MYTDDEINLITLCSFEELSYKNKFVLLNGLESAKPDFAKFEPLLIKSIPSGVYNNVKEKYFSSEYRARILKNLQSRGINCVTIFSDGYPELLRHTPFPPIVLYCIGNEKLLKTRCFSVVGSRHSLTAALKECKKIAGELIQQFTVVTGAADGGDSAAIEGAIQSGKIISVLAYGSDYAFSAYNGALLKSVAKSGLLISEHPPKVAPKNYLFPVRNRIIAGMSEGTLVVSAGLKSGALITADYAVEYGRQVFAFPYSIGVSSGAGCNSLIKKGGLLAENILDIFSLFGLDFKEPEKENLSAEEKAVYEIICDGGEVFVSDIAEKLGKLPHQLIPVLSSLEIKGLAVRLGGNRYSALLQ